MNDTQEYYPNSSDDTSEVRICDEASVSFDSSVLLAILDGLSNKFSKPLLLILKAFVSSYAEQCNYGGTIADFRNYIHQVIGLIHEDYIEAQSETAVLERAAKFFSKGVFLENADPELTRAYFVRMIVTNSVGSLDSVIDELFLATLQIGDTLEVDDWGVEKYMVEFTTARVGNSTNAPAADSFDQSFSEEGLLLPEKLAIKKADTDPMHLSEEFMAQALGKIVGVTLGEQIFFLSSFIELDAHAPEPVTVLEFENYLLSRYSLLIEKILKSAEALKHYGSKSAYKIAVTQVLSSTYPNIFNSNSRGKLEEFFSDSMNTHAGHIVATIDSMRTYLFHLSKPDMETDFEPDFSMDPMTINDDEDTKPNSPYREP